ncbi:MAG TPA: glycoside hydrolase family 38 C-terminal domain-containing protein [Capsulimonadaceae bacterium]
MIDIVEASLLAAGSSPGALEKALQSAEDALSDIGKEAKKYTIHCVGHGHIDMNWMWSWPETVATTHDTFASVLSLMRRYPTLTYSQSQGTVYALVERYHPAMFEEIRQRVKEGRWEVTAAHWVEGDKNLVSGESICRHLFLTRSYFFEKFGIEFDTQTVDWEPDTFGHAASIPSMLAQGGVKHYYCCRPGGGFDHPMIGDPRPRLFYWKAPDGAQVLVNREATWYNSYVNIGDNIAMPFGDFIEETGLHNWLNVFGIGNHGGGPTRTEIDYLLELAEWPIYPAVEFSTSARYFATIDAELESGRAKPIPTIEHELNFEFAGCYTSQSLIKQANRFGENYLIEAETLGAIAQRSANTRYPVDQMREAWLKVLFNQFHDILPGSGIRQTREHATAAFQEVGAITGAIKRNALTAITARIDTAALLPPTWAGELELDAKPGGVFEAGAGLGATTTGISVAGSTGNRFRPVVVLNTCAWQRSESVRVSLYDTGFNPDAIVVVSDDDTISPAMAIGKNPNDWGHSRIDVVFDAVDIPPLGYRTFVLAERSSLPAAVTESARPVSISPKLEVTTPFLSYKIDADRGGIRNLVDLRTGAILSTPESSPMGAIEYVTERPIDMSAWVLGSEVDPGVALKATSSKLHGAPRSEATGKTRTEAPVGIEHDLSLAVPGTTSTVKLRQRIHSLEPRIDFEAVIDWREIGSNERGIPGLVVSVPIPLTSITARYEIPFGSVTRDLYNGEELPSLRYAHIGGTAKVAVGKPVHAGVTLIQDCKHGYSVVGNDKDGYELRLRLVRSSYNPDPLPEVAVTTVRFSLYFHDKPADPASLARLGALWNCPPIVLPAAVQRGDAPLSRSYARVISPNHELTALKLSEDKSDLVLRVVELNGEDSDAVIELGPELLHRATKVSCVDLFERPVDGIADLTGGFINVRVPANGFVSLLVR